MTATPTASPTATPRSQFVAGRVRAERMRNDEQERAVRTVAGNARDGVDFTTLLAMLGLADTREQVSLSRRLAVYVERVAAAIGVPAEASAHEVTDTATAYIALDHRSVTPPYHDLMLVWDERLGWYLAAETQPTEQPRVVAYLVGATVPSPAEVARFVIDTTSGHGGNRIRPVLPPIERTALADSMATVC